MNDNTSILWSCPKLTIFWEAILKTPKDVFHQNFIEDLNVVLWGLIPEGTDGTAKQYLQDILLTAAISCITLKWFKPNPSPTYNNWVKKVQETYQMEQFSLRIQKHIFIKYWRSAMVNLT